MLRITQALDADRLLSTSVSAIAYEISGVKFRGSHTPDKPKVKPGAIPVPC